MVTVEQLKDDNFLSQCPPPLSLQGLCFDGFEHFLLIVIGYCLIFLLVLITMPVLLFLVGLQYQKDFKFCYFYLNKGIFSGIRIPLYRFGSNSVLDNGSVGGISCLIEEEQSVLDSFLLAQVWNMTNYNPATCRFMSFRH